MQKKNHHELSALRGSNSCGGGYCLWFYAKDVNSILQWIVGFIWRIYCRQYA